MSHLRYLTAGESHGRALVGILEGMPAGLPIKKDQIDLQLRRRQGGYGRSTRMQIEQDSVEVLAGIRAGVTLGSPIALVIWNRDWANWSKHMDPWAPPPARYHPVTVRAPAMPISLGRSNTVTRISAMCWSARALARRPCASP